MTSVVISPYTREQIEVWLRGLFTVALADGDFDEQEQELLISLSQQEVAPAINLSLLEPISAKELAAALGQDKRAAENFLRTAVMVAIADGIYSACEDHVLSSFCRALDQKEEVLTALRHTLYDHTQVDEYPVANGAHPHHLSVNVLHPVRYWLDGLEIHEPKVARFLCKMIPPQCPFERDVKLFGHKIVHIPPLCKLNPLYEQLVGLRFRALCYLADECGEDVSQYC